MIEFSNVTKVFKGKQQAITALDNVNLTIETGDIYGIIGLSGAGKSTLIRMINQLEKPTSGTVTVDGVCVNNLSFTKLQEERKRIGMIFQQFNLLNSKTVFENVAIPLRIAGESKERIKERTLEVLRIVGLEHKEQAYPDQLSGGQKQRVGIARALATGPSIILSDEATSALDPDTMESILDLLKEINRKLHITIVLVTHQIRAIQKICNKVAVMKDGRIIENGPVYQVFSNPQTDLTKDFVRTVISDSMPKLVYQWLQKQPDQSFKVYRMKFLQDSAFGNYVYQINKKYPVETQILHAAVTELDEKVLGILILQISGAEEQIEAAIAFARQQGIICEEVAIV